MHDLLTFFRNRRQDGGREWRIEAGDVQLCFHSKSYLDISAYLQELPPGVAYPTYKDQLAEAIAQGGGGLMVEARPVNDGWSLDIIPVAAPEASAYQPPQTVFSIEQGGELAEFPLQPEAPSKLSLPARAYLIVPVDLEAEEHFRAFRVHFSSWFPSDFESAMLNLLRRPSLELRLERLERAVDAQYPPRSAWAGKILKIFPSLSAGPGDEGLAHARWVWGGLGMASGFLIALLLIPVLGLFGNHPSESPATQAGSTETAVNQPTGDKPGETALALPKDGPDAAPKAEAKPLEPSQSEALVQALKSLNETLSKSGNDTLIKLRQTHFSALDGTPQTPSIEDQNLYWGLLKLPAASALLKTKPQTPELQALTNKLASTDKEFAEAYKTVADKHLDDIAIADGDWVCLLVYSVQHLDADGKLGLKNQLQEKVPNLDLQQCPYPTPEQAASGINKLTSGLGQIPPSPKPVPAAKPRGKAR